MPTYQYRCTQCGHELEAVQKFTDDPLTVCPSCEGSLRKVFSAVGVVFKGSGFYRTDSRSAGDKSASGTHSGGDHKSGSDGANGSGTKKDAASSGSSESGSASKSESSSSGSSSSTKSTDKSTSAA